MPLIQVSENVMINSNKIDSIEFMDGVLMITINSRRHIVTMNNKKIMNEIQSDLNVDPRTKQFFGG